MKKSYFGLALLTASLSLINSANAYIVEIKGSSNISDITYDYEEDNAFMSYYVDSETTVEGTGNQLHVNFFFKNVDTTSGPLEQAAFLNKAGSAFIEYSQTDLTVKEDRNSTLYGASFSKEEYTSETIATGARIIIGSVILEPAYTIDNSDRKIISPFLPYFEDSYETTMLKLGIGGYIGSRQEMVFTYGQGESELQKNAFYPATFSSTDTIQHLALRYKGVFSVTQNFYIAPHASLYSYDYDYTSQRILEAGVMFYPLKNLGVGPTFSISSESEYAYNSSNNETTSTINVSYFPIENLSINASLGSSSILEKFDSNDSSSSDITNESTGIFLKAGITGRF